MGVYQDQQGNNIFKISFEPGPGGWSNPSPGWWCPTGGLWGGKGWSAGMRIDNIEGRVGLAKLDRCISEEVAL
jgi:hypothetical protein